jgi:hypothetical protein
LQNYFVDVSVRYAQLKREYILVNCNPASDVCRSLKER